MMHDGIESEPQASAIEAAVTPPTLDEIAKRHGSLVESAGAVASGAIAPQQERAGLPELQSGKVELKPMPQRFQTSYVDLRHATPQPDESSASNTDRLINPASATKILSEANQLLDRPEPNRFAAAVEQPVLPKLPDQGTEIVRPASFKPAAAEVPLAAFESQPNAAEFAGEGAIPAANRAEAPQSRPASAPEQHVEQASQRNEKSVERPAEVPRTERRQTIEQAIQLDPVIQALMERRPTGFFERVGAKLKSIGTQLLGTEWHQPPARHTEALPNNQLARELAAFRELDELYQLATAAAERADLRLRGLMQTATEIKQTVAAHETKLDQATDPRLRDRLNNQADQVQNKARELVGLIRQQEPLLRQEMDRATAVADWTRDTRQWLVTNLDRLGADTRVTTVSRQLHRELNGLFTNMQTLTAELTRADQDWQQLDEHVGELSNHLLEADGDLTRLVRAARDQVMARRLVIDGIQRQLFDNEAVDELHADRGRWAKRQITDRLDDYGSAAAYWNDQADQATGLSLRPVPGSHVPRTPRPELAA